MVLDEDDGCPHANVDVNFESMERKFHAGGAETGRVVPPIGHSFLAIPLAVVSSVVKIFRIGAVMNNELDRLYYRETVRDSGVGDEKVIRQHSGISVYAHVRVAVEGLSRGRGNVFSWNAGLNIPAKFAPAVTRGVQDAMNVGVLAGLQLIDVHVSIEDGSYHEVDSTSEAFSEATERAVAQALRQAQPQLLEAISLVTIRIPQEYAAIVQTTVASDAGEELHSGMPAKTITVKIPTSDVDGLMVKLLEVTDGQAKISSASAGFRPASDPPDPVNQWVERR
ncbi:MAG TPA: hypothetical protein VNM47_19815 [Terriglobia bacterium]|nr:hypothetical protein [Terriglobia bacterium]